MEKVFGIIYKTTNLINGKIYIGQTTQLNNKSYIGSGTKMKLAIKKYGKENFIREILEECYNKTDLDIYEELYIEQYNSRDKSIGYNIAKGSVLGAIGEMSPSKLPEVRAKWSKSIAEYYSNPKNREKVSNTTRKYFEDPKNREKSSNATRKYFEDPKNREKVSKKSKEVWSIPEYKLKMSEIMKESHNTLEFKDKRSKYMKELFDVPEYKLKILKSIHSTESKEKRSKSLKNIWNMPGHKEKRSKPVLQYDKQGNFIAEYYGATEAERQTGIDKGHISSCCTGKRKSAGGYIWKYK